MWLLIPAGLLAYYLLMVGGKKGVKKGQYVIPKAGETWTLILKTSRPLQPSDYDTWFQALAPLAAVRGVTSRGDNTYVVTMSFTGDPSPLKVGQTTQIVGGTITLIAAVQAPIASVF